MKARFISLPLLTAGLLLGCSDQSSGPQAPASPPNKLLIKGSNTVGEELAPALVADYKKDHPDVGIDIETKGTASGFWGLIAGVCDVAAASREPIQDEKQQAEVHHVTFKDNVIGAYSIAIIVNANNPVKDLNREQVRDIFTGAITNWKDVGGQDAPITLCVRDPISGTYLGFRELAMENKAYSTNLHTFTNYAGIAQAVAKDPGAIGYAGFDYGKLADIKTLSIQGITPDATSVNSGKYPFSRLLHLYTNKDRESQLASDFIKYIQSANGQATLVRMGYVGHP